MNTKKVLQVFVTVLVVTVLGVVAYVVAGGNEMSTETQTTPQENEASAVNPTENTGESNDLAQLMKNISAETGTLKCEFETEGQTGEFYLDDSNMAVRTVVEEQEVSHIVFKDSQSYVWQEGNDSGILLDENIFQETLGNQQNNEGFSNPYALTFDGPEDTFECEEKNVKSSRFEVPADISFQNMGAASL